MRRDLVVNPIVHHIELRVFSIGNVCVFEALVELQHFFLAERFVDRKKEAEPSRHQSE